MQFISIRRTEETPVKRESLLLQLALHRSIMLTICFPAFESGTSSVQFSNMTFNNLTGYVSGLELVNFACSTDAPCPGIVFNGFDVQTVNSSAGQWSRKPGLDAKIGIHQC